MNKTYFLYIFTEIYTKSIPSTEVGGTVTYWKSNMTYKKGNTFTPYTADFAGDEAEFTLCIQPNATHDQIRIFCCKTANSVTNNNQLSNIITDVWTTDYLILFFVLGNNAHDQYIELYNEKQQLMWQSYVYFIHPSGNAQFVFAKQIKGNVTAPISQLV